MGCLGKCSAEPFCVPSSAGRDGDSAPECSRVPQHLRGVSAEGRGRALRRFPEAMVENAP